MSAFFTNFSQGLYNYIDLLWLPVAWFTVHKHQRLKTIAFITACILTLRTQVELMDSTGFDAGFLPFWDASAYSRGLITYGLVIALFLILAYYSPRTDKVVFFAAALSIYILAFCTSMLLMAL